MLVIFDCDGVLVDSEILDTTTKIKELSKLNIHITLEESLKKFTGLSLKKIFELLEQQYNRYITEKERSSIQQAIQKELSLKVQAINGISALLQDLQTSHIPYCLASSGTLDRIHTSLKASKLSSFFTDSSIFSSSMVPQGKPFPDLFLYAAHAMNVLPDECWVIEDSVAGIQAAKAAKMSHIAFVGGQHAQYPWYKKRIFQETALHICENMMDVKSLLQKNLSLK